jgi:8-oxo-(d)GTP phosphatase
VTVVLLRHAAAGDRDEWEGDDRLRPLDKRGRKQAKALRELLADDGPRGVVSSPYLRCTETVAPLSDALGLELELDDRLAEGAARGDALAALAEHDGFVACTHGDIVEAVLGRSLKKGAAAWLEVADGDVRVVRTLKAPT